MYSRRTWESYLSEIVGSGDRGRGTVGRGRRKRRSLGRMCTVRGRTALRGRLREICWHEMYYWKEVEIKN